jgi:hypothetical protein
MKLFFALFGVLLAISSNAGTVTLIARNGSVFYSSETITLQSNQVASVVFWGSEMFSTTEPRITLDVTVPHGTNFETCSLDRSVDKAPVIAGPATIQLNVNNASARSLCTLRIDTDNCSQPAITSTSVVIPSDANGPVNILLESSADLITWNSALPGTYGTTQANRFFRVRAVR